MTDLTQSLRVEMERFLAQFAGEKVLLIPNEGNAGDCLILASTLTAMAKASIDVEVVDNGADYRNQTVFLGGGGNLIDVYRGMRQSIEACRSKAARIVLLPHTIRGNAGLLKSLDDRVTIWCRDKRSLEHVGSLNPDLDCRLGHDMAFHCDAAEFLSDPACNEYGLPQLRVGLQRVGVNLDRLPGWRSLGSCGQTKNLGFQELRVTSMYPEPSEAWLMSKPLNSPLGIF